MDHHNHVKPEESLKEYAKFYGLFLATVAASYGLMWSFSDTFDGLLWMRMFMGSAWLIYAVFQLIELEMFAYSFASYDLIAAKFKFYALGYPFIEIAWAVMYFADLWPIFRDVSVILFMVIGIIGIRKSLRQNRVIPCACLGTIIKLPLSKVTLYEDALMGVMAAAILVIA